MGDFVPFVHAVAIAQDADGYLTAEKFPKNIQGHFRGDRQLKVGNLHTDKDLAESLALRVGYLVKGKTASLTGKLLRQFIAMQLETRADTWTVKYTR